MKQVMENQFQLDVSKLSFTLKVHLWLNSNFVGFKLNSVSNSQKKGTNLSVFKFTFMHSVLSTVKEFRRKKKVEIEQDISVLQEQDIGLLVVFLFI